MSSFANYGNLGGDSVKRAETLLVNIEHGVEKAVKSALPRTTAHLRSETTKKVREKYDISVANIRANENVRVSYRYGQESVAAILFEGSKLGLFKYGGASPKSVQVKAKRVLKSVHGEEKWVHPGIAASGHQLKGEPVTRFENAFVQSMPHRTGRDHLGIFERTGGKLDNGDDEITEIMGSAVPQMIGRSDNMEELTKDANEYFSQRLDHEVTRLLNGWGKK